MPIRRATLCLTILAGAMVAGCGGDSQPSPKRDPLARLTAEYGEPVRVYIVRGRVESLPDPEVAGTNFVVHHEAIDDFVGRGGEVVGMSSMSMPFPLGEGVQLPAGLAVGDKVAIHFAQWLEPVFRYVAFEVERLPPDTVLQFGRAQPGQPPS